MIAYTMSKFAYKAYPQDGSVILLSSTYFFPCNSWLNYRNIQSSIEHEQLHFDISEVHRRLFIKRVSDTRSTEDLFATTTKAIFREVADQRKAMNDMYDKETINGQNPEQQKRWNNKIKQLLDDLDKYNSSSVTINLK